MTELSRSLHDGSFANASTGSGDNLVLLVRRVLLSFLQSYFSHEPIPGMRWREDVLNTGIFIADTQPDDVEGEDPRPAIITERGTIQRTPIAHGQDLLHFDHKLDRSASLWLLSLHVNFHCISRWALQSEELAWVVHDLVLIYEDQIAGNMPLQSIGASQIAHTVPYNRQQKDDWHDTVVTFQMHCNRKLIVESKGYPTLKGIQIQDTSS